MKINVRIIYLYLFSFIGLVVVVIGSIRLIDLGIKSAFFKDADTYEYYSAPIDKESAPFDEQKMKENAAKEQTKNRQRDLSNSLAMIIVGAPLYIYHWKTIKKENSK